MLVLTAASIEAQTLYVESFKLLETDLTANTAGTMKKDQNGDVAAIIKVVTSETGFTFENGMLGIVETVQETGEVWVYVPHGTNKLTIRHQQLGVLRDWSVPITIEKGRTYELRLVSGSVRTIVEQAVTSQYVVFTVNPSNAVVYLDDDGEAHALDSEGQLSMRMPSGNHTYRVSAPSYMPESGAFEVKDKKVVQSVSLQSALATLTVTAKGDAEIWINDKLHGNGSCTVGLESGLYMVEARKKSHRTVSREITLARQEKRTIDLDAPEPIYGKADITSIPLAADVYIDGKLVGQTPDLFEKLLIGNRELVIRKAGYADYETQLTVTEGKTSELSCTLTEGSKHEYVNLGLSVRWATHNVGASSPEEYGDYFAWGETSPKSEYSWDNLKYCNDKKGKSFSKYNQTERGTKDNRTVLELSDDAARVNWGGSWRMPTKAEFEELLSTDNCTWTWYESGNSEFNGVAGYKVTSRKSGYVGNYIFLPAAGYRDDTYLDLAGSYGNYWSSSLDTDGPSDAWSLFFNSGYRRTDYSYDRYCGRSVRPVCP